ncbi:MAG: adenosine deaminase [Acidimicrobiia bacterium]
MDVSTIPALPKAVLHDHLDGGLRPETIFELADEQGYTGLPASDVDGLATWFYQGASGSLRTYLEAFEQTVSVMQTESAISRVAYEAGVDLAVDGVVYAEVRYGPSLSMRRGLSREAVLEAILDGFERAKRDSGICIYGIATALRHETDSGAVARAASRYVGRGIVAFDLAGPEKGFPPDEHLEACNIATEAGLGVTLHAGEGDGPNSMWRALALCGAQRLGHGVHVVEDAHFERGTLSNLGSFARRVRDHRIPLEVAITSNLHTGSWTAAPEHPFGALYAAGFNVSINTDNRLMSGISMSDEYALAATAFGLSTGDLNEITVNAIKAGFGDWPTRRALIDRVEVAAEG